MDLDKEIVQEMFKSLDRIDSNLDEINITLAVQAEQLKTHIKRSDEIEKYVELIEEQMKPLQTHVNRVNSLILLLGGVFALIAAIKGVLEIIKILH